MEFTTSATKSRQVHSPCLPVPSDGSSTSSVRGTSWGTGSTSWTTIWYSGCPTSSTTSYQCTWCTTPSPRRRWQCRAQRWSSSSQTVHWSSSTTSSCLWLASRPWCTSGTATETACWAPASWSRPALLSCHCGSSWSISRWRWAGQSPSRLINGVQCYRTVWSTSSMASWCSSPSSPAESCCSQYSTGGIPPSWASPSYPQSLQYLAGYMQQPSASGYHNYFGLTRCWKAPWKLSRRGRGALTNLMKCWEIQRRRQRKFTRRWSEWHWSPAPTGIWNRTYKFWIEKYLKIKLF